jgi:hypothetical protein
VRHKRDRPVVMNMVMKAAGRGRGNLALGPLEKSRPPFLAIFTIAESATFC